MNSPTSPPATKSARLGRLAILTLALLTAITGWASYHYLHHTIPERYYEAGKEAHARGDLQVVNSAADALSDKEGYEPHAHILRAMVLLRTGRLKEAIDECGHAREHPDTKPLAFALSGEALYRAGFFRDADRILSTALELDPSLIDARRLLAATYYDIGAMHQAMDHLRIVAEQAPDDPRPHRLMGLIDKDFQKYGRSVDEFRESLRRDPNQPEKHEVAVELAQCLIELRRYPEVIETLQSCPLSAEVLALQAECHYGNKDLAAARKQITEVYHLAPNNLPAMRLEAKLDLEADDPDSAVKVLERAILHHPNQWRVRYQLSRAYQRLGEQELAKEQIKASDELRELQEQFAELHEKAMAEPSNEETRYELGLAAIKLGKPELAQNWFRATLGLNPQHQGAVAALQKLEKPPPQAKAVNQP
jgi:tetratricopeptide (TPR) repeat protein